MNEYSQEFEQYQQYQHEKHQEEFRSRIMPDNDLLWAEYNDIRDHLTEEDCENFDWEDEEYYDD